jgi:hypothetical protein
VSRWPPSQWRALHSSRAWNKHRAPDDTSGIWSELLDAKCFGCYGIIILLTTPKQDRARRFASLTLFPRKQNTEVVLLKQFWAVIEDMVNLGE